MGRQSKSEATDIITPNISSHIQSVCRRKNSGYTNLIFMNTIRSSGSYDYEVFHLMGYNAM
jgi:hypothetical protein